MQIDTHQVKVQKTARYSTYGTFSKDTSYLWIVLHGSNMLCEQMIYKFAEFDPSKHFVIAPEGLSRFYKDGFGGDVVSAWMTSRDRLHEIEDFSDYLSQLLITYQSQLSPACKTIVMGFSQGGTTMYRWLHHNSCKVDAILGYSCWIPEDINLAESKTPLSMEPHIYTYGKEDQFLTPEKIEVVESIIQKNNLAINVQSYQGKHKVDKAQLKYLYEHYLA